MLKITIPSDEYFNEVKQEFFTTEEVTLELEHSLVSLSKWEAKWEKPFLASDEKSTEQTIDYIRCMTLGEEAPPYAYKKLTNRSKASDEILDQIRQYIDAKMTATWFTDTKPAGRGREIITAELIYYWMVALTIPVDFESWHLNRLLTLIKVCNLKNQPQKKMSASEIAARNRALNEQRLASGKTAG